MNRSYAWHKFARSTQISYEDWREGTPYDLDAFAAMTPAERDEIAASTRAKGEPDWRDMQVLAAHGSSESFDRLRDFLTTQHSPRTRAWALRTLIDAGKTSGSVPDVQLAHIIDDIDENTELMPALDLAAQYGGPMTRLALLRGVQHRPAIALNFAAELLDLHGLSSDMAAFDPKFRPTLLKLLPDNPAPTRTAAFAQVCAWLNIDPDTIPTADSADFRAWAERTFPRVAD